MNYKKYLDDLKDKITEYIILKSLFLSYSFFSVFIINFILIFNFNVFVILVDLLNIIFVYYSMKNYYKYRENIKNLNALYNECVVEVFNFENNLFEYSDFDEKILIENLKELGLKEDYSNVQKTS